MTTARVDRAALVRRAMVELVAEKGVHGTSMSQVAGRAGVATGTAYVHYESKEALLIAAFVEAKSQIGAAVAHDLDLTAPPRVTFESIWRRLYEHLRTDPHLAKFLNQIDESPLRERAHDALADDDPLVSLGNEMAEHLIDLPVEIIYELGLAPAVRLAASDSTLDDAQLSLVIDACWRAIGR